MKLLVFMFVISFQLLAQGPSGQGMRQGEKKGLGLQAGPENRPCQELMYKQLDLNDKQIEQLISYKKEERQKRFEDQRNLQDIKHQFNQELAKDKLDESHLKKLIDQVAELTKAKMLYNLESVKKMRSILTDEQRKKLELEFAFNKKGRRGENFTKMGRSGKQGQRGDRRGQKQSTPAPMPLDQEDEESLE